MFRSLRSRSLLVTLFVVLPLVLAACGGSSSTGGGPTSGSTNVTVTLTEFKVDSSLATFTQGTAYHFTIKNAGKVPHEWLIINPGDTNAANSIFGVKQDQLLAGATVTVDYTFTKAGSFEFACLLPGHYEQGMHTAVTVK